MSIQTMTQITYLQVRTPARHEAEVWAFDDRTSLDSNLRRYYDLPGEYQRLEREIVSEEVAQRAKYWDIHKELRDERPEPFGVVNLGKIETPEQAKKGE